VCPVVEDKRRYRDQDGVEHRSPRESRLPHRPKQHQLVALCGSRGIGERLIDHRVPILPTVVETVVHQDRDLVLVVQEHHLFTVANPARAQQTKAHRARRQHGPGDLCDEPIVEGPAHPSEVVVVGKQAGSIDHTHSLINREER